MDALLPLLKEFGFPIALCVVLMWAIRHQNQQLVKAYIDRIKTLERIVEELQAQIRELNTARMTESREYGHTLKDVATRYATTIREHDQLMRDTLPVMRRLTDAVADLLRHDYRPHRIPSSAELPADPAQRPTETLPARAHG